MRISTSQLAAAKVSDLRFRANEGKFPRHFKGVFRTGNMEVRILPGQPVSRALRESISDTRRKARQWGAFANSLGSSFRNSRSQKGDSLRRIFEKLPSLGNYGGDWVRSALHGRSNDRKGCSIFCVVSRLEPTRPSQTSGFGADIPEAQVLRRRARSRVNE